MEIKVLLAILALVLQDEVKSAKISEFRLIQNPNPTAWAALAGATKVERYWQNIPNLKEVSELVKTGNVTHYYMDGPWAVFIDPDYERISDEGTQVEFESSLRYGPPSTGKQWGQTEVSMTTYENGTRVTDKYSRVPMSIRHIGNVDQNAMGISFYTKARYGGNELYFNGKMLFLPYHIAFASYGYSMGLNGNRYKIFSDLKSKPTCFGFEDSRPNYKLKDSTYMTVSIISQESCELDSWDESEDSGNDTDIVENMIHQFNEFDSKLTEPALVLYTVERNALYFEGTELSLPFRHDSAIIRIFGDRNYTVFSGPNFSGENKCLVNTEHRNSILHYLYGGIRPKSTVKVQSIKRGCTSDPKQPCGLDQEYEILGYEWKNPEVVGDNANPILHCI